MSSRSRRAAFAGIVAAAVWAAAEPMVRRVCRTEYSDVRLLGAPLSPRHWRAAGTALHLANGAAAGALFDRLGVRGWKAGIAAAELESALLWPGMVVIDRFHPDRRNGAWPPLLRNRRVFAQEVVVHAIFGAVLGALLRERLALGANSGPHEGERGPPRVRASTSARQARS